MNENVKKYLIYFAVLLIVGVAGYWLYLTYWGSVVHSPGNPTVESQIGSGQQSIGAAQHGLDTATSGIVQSQSGAARIEQSVDASIERNKNSRVLIESGISLVGECQQIIGAAEQRAKSGAK